LVAGTPELDFDALENSSEYEGGYDEDSPVVGSIWKWVQSASLSTQERFLKFCTGSSKGTVGICICFFVMRIYLSLAF
jgi:ubiquitin-protein ligase E3 A